MCDRRLATLLGLLLSWSCGSGPVQPADLALNEDICSQCRMTVSRQQFAAQVVWPDGRVDQFDDVGCLVRWLRTQHPGDKAGYFVGDYQSGEWIRADQALFVRSEQIQTPMRSGLVAVRDEESARHLVDEGGGKILRWEQVNGKGVR